MSNICLLGCKGSPFIVVSFRSRAIAPHDASPFFALPPFSGSAISVFFASAVAALRRVAESTAQFALAPIGSRRPSVNFAIC